jgi:hypothetical protein
MDVDLRRLALLLLLVPAALSAQEAARQSGAVVIANRTIIVLLGPIAGYSAEERVRASIERIEATLDSDPYAEVAFADSDAGHVAALHDGSERGAGRAEGEVVHGSCEVEKGGGLAVESRLPMA